MPLELCILVRVVFHFQSAVFTELWNGFFSMMVHPALFLVKLCRLAPRLDPVEIDRKKVWEVLAQARLTRLKQATSENLPTLYRVSGQTGPLLHIPIASYVL
jgi:hypothetical protein